MHRKDPLLLKSSTDLREVAPPVTMMALLSSGLSASVDVDSMLMEDADNVAVEKCDVVIIVAVAVVGFVNVVAVVGCVVVNNVALVEFAVVNTMVEEDEEVVAKDDDGCCDVEPIADVEVLVSFQVEEVELTG